MPPEPQRGPILIGVTRFSVDPASIIEPPPDEHQLAQHRAAIYSAERITNRWALFQAFALPSLEGIAARYDRFFHLIAYSSALPPEMRKQLVDLAKRHRRWLRLIEVKPQARLSDMVRAVVQVLAAGRRSFNFRLDDDDALSPDFVDAVTQSECKEGTVLSFDLGNYVQRIADDRFLVLDTDYPRIAIGLGIFCGRSHDCVFDLPVHHTIPEARIYNIRDKNYWLRTIHAHNDSGTRSRRTTEVDIEQACAQLTPRFGFLSLHTALQNLVATTALRRDESASKALYKIQ